MDHADDNPWGLYFNYRKVDSKYQHVIIVTPHKYGKIIMFIIIIIIVIIIITIIKYDAY